MRALLFLCLFFYFSSCCPKPDTHKEIYTKVWGSKPIYADINYAKQVSYVDSALPVVNAGNICALGFRLYQVDLGRGIHVIDNSIPSLAHRIGFISVNSCSQISIKDGKLFTNCYDDLVVIDITDLTNVHLVKRVQNAFPDGLGTYYLVQPEESGYYECPTNDSVVIGWRKDSVWSQCYKN